MIAMRLMLLYSPMETGMNTDKAAMMRPRTPAQVGSKRPQHFTIGR